MPIIEGHHDFGVLERRLAALVREARAGGSAAALAPLAVVAPTRRLLSYLQVRLAESFGGLLNLHFFHHHSLAREAAGAAGATLPRVLSDRVEEALVRHLVRSRGGALATYVADVPGSAAALRSTLNDLREAGVGPEAAARLAGSGEGARPVLRLYADYARHLDRPSGEGFTDRAGFLRAALPHLRRFGRTFELIVHYGAYELIGANLEVMRALEDSGARLVYLVPYHAGSPAYAYAGRFWKEMLGQAPVSLPDDPEAGRLLGNRLPAIYDEAAAALPSMPGPIRAFHTQGAQAELREVAQRILVLHRDHRTPLREIAVIARSLEPYAASLRPVFDEHGLPFTTDASLGALREAHAQAVLQLARAALGDFERQPLMDLLRGGLLRVEGRDPSFEAHAWDRLSRRWRVGGGHATWTRELPSRVEDWTPHLADEATDEERARAEALKERCLHQAQALAQTVGGLALALAPLARAKSWSAWSEALQRACRSLLAGFGETSLPEGTSSHPAAAAVLEVLADMRDLDVVGVRFGAEEALAFFESGLKETTIRVEPAQAAGPPGSDNGGVRVLDAMQARGLSFEAVFLIGLNADLFPRRAREDPFLGDADRLALRQGLRAPIPVMARRAEEERLLLAHLLGSARTRLTLSWQRADARGRAKVASLALREVARLTRGVADLKSFVETARRVSSHPARAAAESRAEHLLLSPAEARLGASLQLGSPACLLPVVDRLPGTSAADRAILRAGLPMLHAIERSTPDDLRYDACVGNAAGTVEVWSPSRLERLGTCPQRYFFRHVLGIEEMEEALEGYELEPADLGSRVHAMLHDLYGELRAAGAPTPAAGSRAVERLPAVWRRHTLDLARHLEADYPVFWKATESRWLSALREFLETDLGALERSRALILALEEEVRSRLSLGGSTEFELRGRFDRVVRRGDGAIAVTDYKTSGNLEERVRLTNALKGLYLQVPLYVLLAEALAPAWGAEGAPVEAEILGVGPEFTPTTGASSRPAPGDDHPGRAALDTQGLRDCRGAFLQTLEVLVDLASAGNFPLRAGRWCDTCPFTRACRRGHTPTLNRLEASVPLRDFRTLARKSTKKPFLADAAGSVEEDGAS
jgi:hypothetical protein